MEIRGGNFPVAKLGDSSKVQVGDWVVAIGNALGLAGEPTVTVGVVSALNRTVREPGDSPGSGPFLFDVIQTSAPVNPGNSGGPLVNLDGEVIGINTLIAGQLGPGIQAQGIGFAISTAVAKAIADQITTTGKVIHTYLGIHDRPLYPAAAARLGIPETRGVLVLDVISGSPADRSGLQPGDVITAVDGAAIASDIALAEVLRTRRPGDDITLSVVRNAQKMRVRVRLGQSRSGGPQAMSCEQREQPLRGLLTW